MTEPMWLRRDLDALPSDSKLRRSLENMAPEDAGANRVQDGNSAAPVGITAIVTVLKMVTVLRARIVAAGI